MYMQNIRNGKSSVSRSWQVVLVAIPVLVLGACADEASAPEDPEDQVMVTARIIDNQSGEVRETTGKVSLSVLEATNDTATAKAGCVHIRFCTATFFDGVFNRPNTVVCDTNDVVGGSCTSSVRFSECNGDARAVCGKTRPMGFDPAIPCPISGVSTSICGSGESLVWINF